jgi:hypothetical protein
MIQIKGEAQSLSRFKRNTGEFVRQLKETGQPLVLTIDGRAELVVQDATAYGRLLELVERLEAIESIRAGLEEMEAGKGRPAAEFFAEMNRKYNIPAAE